MGNLNEANMDGNAEERLPTESLRDLEELLGYSFDNTDLLSQALTHRSYVNENESENLSNNELYECLALGIFIDFEFLLLSSPCSSFAIASIDFHPFLSQV